MKSNNNMCCMLLAGGQGSRLKNMTKELAKPAVPFGGKYRIIDFALSNSTNSDIRDIGILTQYKPFKLNEHIGIGSAWDYNRNIGGLRILSPYSTESGGRWYEGTANAIFENLDYLDMISPDYVLILSGDHIYKMNYNILLDYHKRKAADVTIPVMTVLWEDASRFGIVNTDEDFKIEEFEEKPKNPKSNLASMGIYIFNYPLLKKALIEDNEDVNSDHDFGKNILPKLLKEGRNLYVWKFDGYWKDVGTIRSYWEANLDLLDPNNKLDLYDEDWKIYTKSENLPPHYISDDASVSKTLINEGCEICGNVENSVLFSGVKIEKDAVVKNSVILPYAEIASGAKVYNSVVLDKVKVSENMTIGNVEDNKVFLVSEDEIIEE